MGYIDGNTPLTAPLNTHSVAKCIGASSGDVVTLCRSKMLINPKSAKKPLRYPYNTQGSLTDVDTTPKELTDSQFAKVNFGVKINSFTNFDDAISALNTALSGGEAKEEDKAFYYEGPNDGDMCRLTDFVGYKNNAGDWVQIEIENHGSTQANAQKTKMRIRFYEALRNFQSLQSWGAFASLWSSLRFALYVRDKSTNAKYLLPLVSDMEQNEEGVVTFTPTIAGAMEIYPIVTTLRTGADGVAIDRSSLPSGDASVLYIPLPYASYTAWNPVSSGTPEGGQPSLSESISIALEDYNISALGDEFYTVNSFALAVQSQLVGEVNVRVYGGTSQLDKVLLGAWALKFDASGDVLPISYEPKEDAQRFQALGEGPKLIVYYSYGTREERIIFNMI